MKLMLLFLLNISVFAQSAHFEKIVCDSFNQSITKEFYHNSFSEDFIAGFPFSKYTSFFNKQLDSYGKCVSVSSKKNEDDSLQVSVKTKNFYNKFTLHYDSEKKISGLWTSGLESLSGNIERESKYLCSILKKDSKLDYEKHFDKSFIEEISLEKFQSVVDYIVTSYGSCNGLEINLLDSHSAQLITNHSKKLKFSISTSSDSGLIVGLLFKGEIAPPIELNTKEELKSILEKSDGINAMLFKKLGKSSIFSFNEDIQLPLGSTFKLYILLALSEKIKNTSASWDDELEIKDEFKSLPSGDMQNIPSGQKRTLYQFARKMIEISDNTATDHLLAYLGKLEVEKLLRRLNISNPKNFPFLSTMEMFRTRAFLSKVDVANYSKSSRSERLKILEGLKSKSHEELIKGITKWGDTPLYTNEIEWFSSAEEICTLYKSLKEQNSSEIEKILSYNTPFIDKNKVEYAGYKGGSEPGVIYMAYLIERNKEWECFIASRNNTEKAIDQASFFSLVEGSLKLLLSN
ncbi:serine hydrolase [Halobacteriovorax sp. HLS]|uniref:serine hydrolase n=1 Tax=Halobacteriovorax sp. HLS TaxID=2234000 RepID=UPI000FDCA05D|nr:serine hydrolase [Halobacteriovorax sp. HLS]